MESIRALIFASIVGFLALITATWLIMLAYMDLQASGTQAAMDQWAKHPNSLDVNGWEAIYSPLHEALRTTPDNPEYLELMGRLYRWKAYALREDVTAVRNADQEALGYFQHALTISPARPQLWAAVIETKQALGQYDEDMQQAIQVAAEYGAWLPDVQRVIMQAGTAGWRYLTPDSQQAVLNILKNALGVQPKEVIKLAIQYDFRKTLLPLIIQDEALMAFYKKELAKTRRSTVGPL